MIFIGIDIGGTFTDFVCYDPSKGEIQTLKLLSTPEDPSEAVIKGLKRITGKYQEENIHFTCVHGSTVATNALLERKGANTALITTSGFKDILHIGRQDRPELYNLYTEIPQPLIPSDQCFEIVERISSKGAVIIPLDNQSIDKIIENLQNQNIESVAISLLFSFLYPNHENIIADKLTDYDFHVSLSSDILPEFREYERTSTTAVNAYVSPILDKYLEHLVKTLKDYHFRVMQSNGGMISTGEARKTGVRCILSGPAGGVIGADFVSNLIYKNQDIDKKKDIRLITFDMGGTSTDVSLIDGSYSLTNEAVIGGCPIRIPMLDIHTIGAGGGSIAYLDKAGALRVGPNSAGANPGPACYGVGDKPTVTDAHLVLDRIIPDRFLGGKMPLDQSKSIQAISILGERAGIDPYKTALGIIDIVNANMSRALRLISVERGYDPRYFSLISFGGAGGLHASDLARLMGIPKIIISPYASTLSALGMLASDIIKDYVQTVMLPGDTTHIRLKELINPLVQRAFKELDAEGINQGDIEIQQSMDMRYQGQSYELNIPLERDFIDIFEKVHQDQYGYSNPLSEVEIVNLRLRAIGRIQKPVIRPQSGYSTDPSPAQIDIQYVIYQNGRIQTPIFKGELLKPGNQLHGPAIIIRSDTTILLNPRDDCVVDQFFNLIITVDSDNKIAKRN